MDNYYFKIWDEETPVNGVSAERLKQIHPIRGVSYIVFRASQPVIFQWHNPTRDGEVPMTREDALILAQQTVDELNGKEQQNKTYDS